MARYYGYSNLYDYVREQEKSQYLSFEKIREIQFARLKKLLVHAFQHTRYYTNLFQEAGFDPHRFDDFDDLKKIPFLTKRIIRENLDDLVAENYPPQQLHFTETGGTTGVKMKFYRDNACLSPKEASLLRFEKWVGWNYGDRMGIVWPAQQDYVGHWTLKSKIKNELFRRQVVYPAAILDESGLAKYVRLLHRKKPVAIRAFTSPIYEVAKYINQTGPQFQLRGVITTGEPLYAHQRNEIERAFGCKVFNSYRSREAGPLAQECGSGDGMHINEESLYLEIAASDVSSHDDQGEIVITDLLNFGMPLIRYKMNDISSFVGRPCRCGRGLRLIHPISGRTSDVLLTPDQRKIAPGSLVLYLVDEAPGPLGQVQIIQDRIDHLVIRMTKDPGPTERIMEYQKKMVKHLFGNDMEVAFEVVDQIPREPSGKYMFTKVLLG